MDSSAVPKFHSRDILIASYWRSWNGWVWHVWEYRSGWREWIPAGLQLVNLLGLQCGGFNMETMEQVMCEAYDCMQELHDLFQNDVPVIESGAQLNLLLLSQLQYTAHQKSNWYYNSIPMNGYDSYFGCLWGEGCQWTSNHSACGLLNPLEH